MGRCCNGLMVAFRVVQVILSLVALACASYILNKMISLSDAVAELQSILGDVIDLAISSSMTDSDADQALQHFQNVLNSVLGFFQGTPARAITLTAVSAWSIVVIIYLLVAQFKAAKRPDMNRRTIRVTLEVFTLFFWLGGIACAALLAVEFGPLAIIGGPETKLMTKGLRAMLLENKDGAMSKDEKTINDSLTLVDDLLTIGILSILAAGASLICGMVSFVSCIAACCISGKAKRSPMKTGNFYYVEQAPFLPPGRQQPPPPPLPKKDAVYGVKEVGTPNSWISTPSTPGFHPAAYHAVSTYDSPVHNQRYFRNGY